MKNERGSITVYVLVAMFFLIAIIAGRFILANRQLQSQIASLKQLKTVYEKNIKDYYTDSNGVDRNETGNVANNTTNNNTTNNTTTNNTTANNTTNNNTTNNTTDSNIGGYPVYKDKIPIYNNAALKFFSDSINSNESEPYYIYQEAAFYVGGKEKLHILMSDIHVDVSSSALVDNNSTNNISKLVRKSLDFNNHIIYCSDGKYVFYSSTGGGQVEASTY